MLQMYIVKIIFKRFFLRACKCYSGNLGYTDRFVGKRTQITAMTRINVFLDTVFKFYKFAVNFSTILIVDEWKNLLESRFHNFLYIMFTSSMKLEARWMFHILISLDLASFRWFHTKWVQSHRSLEYSTPTPFFDKNYSNYVEKQILFQVLS